MKAIFHIHTDNSYDSLTKPEKVVDFAVRHKVDVLFITDHDTIKGSIKAREYAIKNNLPVTVIIGAEYKTNIGDMTGLFLKKEVKARDYKQFIKEVKEQGGVVILNHPFCGHDTSKFKNLTNKELDFIEVFNARCSDKKNEKALNLANKKKTKRIYGNDAHLGCELGKVIIEFASLQEFKKGKIKPIKTERTKKRLIYRSQIIKGLKKKNLKLIVRSFIVMCIYGVLRK